MNQRASPVLADSVSQLGPRGSLAVSHDEGSDKPGKETTVSVRASLLSGGRLKPPFPFLPLPD